MWPFPVVCRCGTLGRMTVAESPYTARPLDPDTWEDFARLVEANNGVWGGCWCMGFHTEGSEQGSQRRRQPSRPSKRTSQRDGASDPGLCTTDECVGWCQYGSPAELPNIKNAGAYTKELAELPEWRIGCIFTGSRHRGRGVARAAVSAALDAIGGPGVGSSRPTRSRSTIARLSVVRTSTPDPRPCSRSSASPAIGRSPSGAGSCALEC